MKTYLALFFSGLLVTEAYAQSTLYQNSPDRQLDQSLLLYQKELFAGSLYDHSEALEKASTKNQKLSSELHRAISALEIESPDGAGLMKAYILDHPNHPTVATAGLYMGDHFFYKRNYAEALEGYKLVNPDGLNSEVRADLYFKQGYAHFQRDEYDAAAPFFDQAKTLNTAISPDAYYYSGFIAMQNGNSAKAIADLERASTSSSYSAKTPYLLAALYYEAGSYDLLIEFAEPKVNSGAKLDRKEVIHLYLAEAYYEKKNFAKAGENYDAFINSRKGTLSREEIYKGGMAQFEIENYARAADYLKVSANGDDAIAQASSFYLGHAYVKLDNFPFATTSFNTAANFDFNPEMKEEAILSYAKVNLENGSFQRGVKALDDYLIDFPNGKYRSEAESLLSEALINTSDYLRAIEQMEKITNKSSRIQEAYQKVTFYQAMNYYRDKKYNPAIAYLDKSLTYPADQELVLASMFWKGEVYAAKGDLNSAIGSYRQLLGLRPSRTNEYLIKSQYGLGYAYYNSQQYARAEREFLAYTDALRGAVDKQYYDDAILRLGDCYYVQKKFQDAESIFLRAINESNSNIDYAYYRLAVVQNFQSKNADALYQLDRLISGYRGSLYYEDALYQKAQINMEETNYQEAVDVFSTLIREKSSSPFVPYALEGRAVANFSLRNYDQTAVDYQRILKDYPSSENSETALKGLQETLALQGRSGEFGQYLDEYKDSNPSGGSLQSLEFEAAKALYFDQNYPKAIPALENYLRDYPNSGQKVDAIYFLGDSYFQNGQVDNALAQFKLLENEQASPRRLRAMQRIGSIELDREKYREAIPYLQMAAENARNKIEEAEAVQGLMMSYFATQSYNKAIQSADQLLTLDGILPETTPNALLTKAKSQKALKKGFDSTDTLMELVNEYKTIQGAEGLYLLALSFQESQNYVQSNETIFDFSGPFVDFDYWYGRMFLLLADNYQQMGEAFQAKATLESIVEKAVNEEIKSMAQAKLDNLEK